MIELRDVLLFAFALGGAWLGARIEIRHLWRAHSEHGKRIKRLEDVLLFGSKEKP